MYYLKLKQNYELLELNGQLNIAFNGVPTGVILDSVTLGDIALALWNLIKERNVTKAEMLEMLITKFDISTVLALGNIDAFVRILKENGIVED